MTVHFQFKLSLRLLKSFDYYFKLFCLYRRGYPWRRTTCRWQRLRTTWEQRLIVRQVALLAYKQRNKETNNKQTNKRTNKQTKNKQTNKRTNKKANIHTDRHSDGQSNKEKNKEKRLEHVAVFRQDWVESVISLNVSRHLYQSGARTNQSPSP